MMRRNEHKEAALEALQAMETASDKCLECTGQPNISFGVRDWSVGRKCRELASVEILDASTISQLSSDRRRLEYIIQLSKALTTSASELLSLLQHKLNPISSKLSLGFDSLPDELLAVIFNFATLHEQNGTHHAFWLSHVSRRFRQVSLGDCSLWSTIRLAHNMTLEGIERCISRSGKETDLQIIYNFGHGNRSCDAKKFTDSCTSLASRWRSLSLSYNSDGGRSRGPIGQELRKLMQEQHNLALPRLHDLSLIQSHWPIRSKSEPIWMESPRNDFAEITPWEAPNLRVLRCIQYIPPPSFPFTSFTTISLSLMFTPQDIYVQVDSLLVFLSQQRNVLTLELELDSFDGDYQLDDDGDSDKFIVLRSVTTFRFKIMDFDTLSYEESTPRPIWRALRMPNLATLSLIIDSWSGWDPKFLYTIGKDAANFVVETGLLLPLPKEHPHLTSLSVTIPAPRSNLNDEKKSPPKTKSLVLNIPLDKIPHVRNLSVTAFCQISFSRSQRQDVGNIDAKLNHLREVQFCSCENLGVDSLRTTVQSLKDAGAWDTLERVVVKECDLLDYGSALEVIGKERLRFEN